MSIVFSLGCIVTGQFLLRYHTIRPQDSAEETVSPLSAYFSYIPGSIISSGPVPTESTQFMSWFGSVSDHIQPSLLLPALGVSPVPCSVYSRVTHVGLVSLVSFFVAFVFVALVDSEGIWQRYPTAAVIAVFVFLLALCYWRTWEGRPAFVARLCRFLKRPTIPDEGVSLIKSKSAQPNGSANMV